MEQQELVKLTYKSGPRSLQILRGDVVFWVDGVQRMFQSHAAAEVIAIIAGSHPRTITTRSLFELLNRRLHVGTLESYDTTMVRVNYLGRSASIILAGEARELNPTFSSVAT